MTSSPSTFPILERFIPIERTRSIKGLKRLIKEFGVNGRYDDSGQSSTFLMLCSSYGWSEGLSFLLDEGANPLLTATMEGENVLNVMRDTVPANIRYTMLNRLFDAGITATSFDENPLLMLSMCHPKLLSFWISKGADASACDRWMGDGVFHRYTEGLSNAFVSLLKAKKSMVSFKPWIDMLDVLEEAGADPLLKNKDGKTPLDYLKEDASCRSDVEGVVTCWESWRARVLSRNIASRLANLEMPGVRSASPKTRL